MPQNGLHGLVGLGLAKGTARRVPRPVAESFVLGTVFGAMLPDVDMYPTDLIVLVHDYVMRPLLHLHEKIDPYLIHRSFTHSLSAILLVVLVGLGAKASGKRPLEWLCWGLALGMASHDLLDLFFWFAQLDLFWPLSHLPPGHPLAAPLNLWTCPDTGDCFWTKDLAMNLREAGEFAAFALYLSALRVLLADGHVPPEIMASMRKWKRGLWIGFYLAVVGAFFLKNHLYEIFIQTPYLLLMLPYCWRQTFRLKQAITEWCLAPPAGKTAVPG